MGTKQHSNYESLITFTRASAGHALRPVSYGSQLVTNGTFDSDISGWTKVGDAASTISYSSGELAVDAATTLDGALQTIDTVVGKVYYATADITLGTSNQARLVTQPSEDFTLTTTDKTVVLVFVAESTSTTIRVDSYAGTGTFNADNISVKEVTFDESDGTLTLFEHPENVPRVEWDSAGNRLGLLVEEQRVNRFTYSVPDDTNWDMTNCTLTSGAAVAPDGTNTATNMVANSGATAVFVNQDTSVTSGTTYTQSVYAKAKDISWIQITPSTGFTNAYQNFDLSNGVLGDGDVAIANIQAVGNGWYRCSVTVNCTATSSNGRMVITWMSGDDGRVDSDGTFSPDGTQGVYIWGAQLEEGAFPTSYIKTTGSTATRSADVAGMDTADFGFNADGMTVLVEADSFATGTGSTNSLLSISDGTTNNRFSIRVNYAQSWHTSGTSNGNLDYTNVGSTTSKVVYTIDSASQAATIDGASVLEDTSVTVPTGLSELWIGSYYNGANYYLNGHIKSIKYYPRRLTNAQLQDLTS
jgi:hypothetical protein